MNASDSEYDKECPLCLEAFDLDEISFFPCSCEYQICRFCWHHLRMDGDGLCPACRQQYSETPANYEPLSSEEFQKMKNAKKKRSEHTKKMKYSDKRKHLAKVRVLQKNLIFVSGLPPRLCDPAILKRQEYFGRFGKIQRILVSDKAPYSGPSGSNPGVFITYHREEDASRAIQWVNSVKIGGRNAKATTGTTKYCWNFLQYRTCRIPDCMFLHDIVDETMASTQEETGKMDQLEYREDVKHAKVERQSAHGKSPRRNIWSAKMEPDDDSKWPLVGVATGDTTSTSASQTQDDVNVSIKSSQGYRRFRQRGRRGRRKGYLQRTTRGSPKQKKTGDHKFTPNEPWPTLPSIGVTLPFGEFEDDFSTRSTSSPSSFFSAPVSQNGPASVTEANQMENGISSTKLESNVESEDSGRSTAASPLVEGEEKAEKMGNRWRPSRDKPVENCDNDLCQLSDLFEYMIQFGTESKENAGVIGRQDHSHGDKLKQETEEKNIGGLKEELHIDELGFDPYTVSSKALEEMVREEREMTKRREMLQRQQHEDMIVTPQRDFDTQFAQQQQQHHQQFQHQQADMVMPLSQGCDFGENQFPQEQQVLQEADVFGLPHQCEFGNQMVPQQQNEHPMPRNHSSRQQERPISWHGMDLPMEFGNGLFTPNVPMENNVPVELINSNYRPNVGYPEGLSKMNGNVGYPISPRSLGQMRQHIPPRESLDGYRAIPPKMVPNLFHVPLPPAGLSRSDLQVIPSSNGAIRIPYAALPRPMSVPVSEQMFVFHRPPPPPPQLMPNCPYRPHGVRLFAPVEQLSSYPLPIRGNAIPPPLHQFGLPVRQDMMKYPMDNQPSMGLPTQ